jgi:hypothetical protein
MALCPPLQLYLKANMRLFLQYYLTFACSFVFMDNKMNSLTKEGSEESIMLPSGDDVAKY